MTGKERMLIAMQNGQPDRVPCAPDISTMIPQRMTGKPFWEIEMNGNPPLWKAYLDAVRYFGTDAWFIYGGLKIASDWQVQTETQVVSRSDERVVVASKHTTPAGVMTSETTFFVADSASPTEKMIKNLEEDFAKLRYFYPRYTGYDATAFEEMRREVGDLGAFGACVGYPGFQAWYGYVQQGLDELVFAYYDHHDLIEEWRQMEHERNIRAMDFILDARPDFVLLGGSGSITLQSPEIFRELSLPTIKELTRMAKQAGVATMLHSCGKERALVEMVANETDLDCVNPVEPPPQGDCDLAELKRSFGDKIALMGNLHTTDVMLRGTVDEVKRAAMQAIDDAGANGGFILSSGDQCGRDTPDENIFALLEVAKSYGRYK
ncbi:MAG TPA: uroporphyrinogen decarboxylase family protein [Armatimonadota bacterium]|jgi:uroporphyrinogen decarboxylase